MQLAITGIKDKYATNKISCIKALREFTGMGLKQTKDNVDYILDNNLELTDIEFDLQYINALVDDDHFLFTQDSLMAVMAELAKEYMNANESQMAKISELEDSLAIANKVIRNQSNDSLEKDLDSFESQQKTIQSQSEQIADLEKRLNDETSFCNSLKKAIESTRNVTEVMRRELAFKQGIIDELLGVENGYLSPPK